MSVVRRCAGALVVCLSVMAAVTAPGGQAQAEGETQTYLVLAPETGSNAKAVKRIVSTGGTVVARYDAIRVSVVTSTRPDFATAVVGGPVQSAAATGGLGTLAVDETETVETVESADATPDPTTTAEALWSRQWDMRAIQVAEAHTVTAGSPDVVVGVLDSGIDDTHSDLATQVDDSLSAGCVGGVANPNRAAWLPTTSTHGTHVAGTIGAARNGTGIVGVAPGVRLASVRVVTDAGFIYPEAALCGYMWAAEHGFDITNNSYFIDPWEFNCRYDARQRPAWEAVQRALRYAQAKGVLTVASAGNSQLDLQHRFVDAGSPNDGSSPVETRNINNACLDLPAEAPGVLTVSATGPTGLISFYSNYGLGVVEVAAPGGDSRVPGIEPNGRVYSTVFGGGWGYLQGTSMAAPHVAGVAALVKSLHPDLAPATLTAILQSTADEQACPAGGEYTPPGTTVTKYCYGSTANNGFYGYGEVNALAAVTD